MAELNRFKTVTHVVTTNNDTVYTAPVGYSGIVLMAQFTNIGSTTESVTFSHYETSTTTETELIKNYDIPIEDAASPLTGKLILEPGNSIKAQASANSAFKLTLSILESSNG
jgi:hypothetical protein